MHLLSAAQHITEGLRMWWSIQTRLGLTPIIPEQTASHLDGVHLWGTVNMVQYHKTDEIKRMIIFIS